MSKEIEIELNIAGIDITVSGIYSLGEPSEMYDSDMAGYPGSNDEFELESVQINGKEIIDIISDDIYDEIIEKVIENQQNQ